MNDLVSRFVATLAQTETLRPEAIRPYQERLLARLVRHSLDHVPRYRNDPELAATLVGQERINWDRWSALPVIDRPSVQARPEDFHADFTPPDTGAWVDARTSGSTGRSLPHRRSAAAELARNAMFARGYRWLDLDPAMTLGAITLGRTREDRQGRPWHPLGGGPAYHLEIRTPLEQQK